MNRQENSERRKFIRVNCPCKVILHNPERVLDTHTENISAGGIRVILNHGVKEHDLVGLEIYLTAEAVKCEGRVVWVIAYKDEFDTGIEFYEIADKERLVVEEYIRWVVKEGSCDGK